ncbi:MAG: haloacid dehalogenase [Chlorobiaceae bacterium]|jgi:glucose-1-phosphatase|nr:haloacid dehalogenase [Chlorobiaceae bacterium]
MGVILLDIGNVLVKVDFMPFCRAVSRDDAAASEAIMARFCDGELKERLDTGQIAPQAFLDMIAADPHVVEMPRHRIRFAWQDIFQPMPGSIEAVKQLKEHHELWIISDTEPLHFAFLIDRFPVLKSMDRCFLSYEHGYLKSSPEAFRHVLSSSDRQAREFLLIDDRKVNTLSCAETGIRAILFENWQKTLASPLLASLESSSSREEVR